MREHFKCSLPLPTGHIVGKMHMSSKCTQHVITSFQAPSPPVTPRCHPPSHQTYSTSSSTPYATNQPHLKHAILFPSRGFRGCEDIFSFVLSSTLIGLTSNRGRGPFQILPTTGCIEEFLKAENFFKNTKKKTNLISLFCTLKLASIFLTFLT